MRDEGRGTRGGRRACRAAVTGAAVVSVLVTVAVAQDLPSFDFTKAAEVQEWKPTHDIGKIEATPEGMAIEITGGDPYTIGPARDFPAGTTLFIKIRLKSEQGGDCQVFYFATNATEENSVRFPVQGGGKWEDLDGILPALGPGYRFRIDPPGTGGKVVIAGMSFKVRAVPKEPEWPTPVAPAIGADALTVSSGDLQLAHAPDTLGGFVVRVAGKDMACGHTRPVIGYTRGPRDCILDVAKEAKVEVRKVKDKVAATAVFKDADGVQWKIEQEFGGGKREGAIDVQTRISVNMERSVFYLPLFIVLPGVGSFGEKKGEGLFAGLEYLDNEPSSSEADIVGPGSKRQVPDTLKITFPLMAVQADGQYVGLIWDNEREYAALFDSPDRLFRSGGHMMGVLFPGSDGRNRIEGSLLPHTPAWIRAGEPLVLNATLIGGKGDSVVPAVQQFVALRGLPPVPQAMDLPAYVSLAAAGWLDSKGREGALYRHAVWPGFKAQPAGDAAIYMDWLACQTKNADLVERLHTTAKAALAEVKAGDYNGSGVSHVRYPLGSLCYGAVEQNAARAEQSARGQLAQFGPDGSIKYKKPASGPDYGKTHSSPEANGLAAPKVAAVLEEACVAGDPQLVREGLRLLHALDKFDNTVPRGAQTWEVPLHTPDILASAYLVRAYARGYELTGEQQFLDRAVYWAWTGVPFVYLTPPTRQPVGVYATIAVLGATNWQAPVWFGQPVQWCGLVYADALYVLSHHDPKGPWKQIADGITACGIQFTWTTKDKDRQGLLPDFYHLHQQVSDGPAINPGTVQANAVRLFDKGGLYDFRACRANGWHIHAPGTLTALKERGGKAEFKVEGWLDRPYYVLVSGLKAAPAVKLNGDDAPIKPPHQYVEKGGRLILQVTGSPTIEIQAADATGK
ncbi:MAG: hypothetical protein NTW87_13405 [Planctomycetota bacterium]|nr:hypothetical protein [Planctomycetota bacterium]